MFNKFFEFSDNPFPPAPDPKFFYTAKTFLQALTSLIYAIETRSGVVSLTGEVGTGKTALIHVLLDRIDKKAKRVFIFNSSVTFEELLFNILSDLQVPVEGKTREALLSRMNGYLAQIGRDETVVVIIDEAHKLPEEVLKEIGALVASNNSSSSQLQLIFVGQPSFEEKLNAHRLRQINDGLKIRCRIRALNEEESRGYIEHRLKLVGSSISNIFTPKAISMISSYAKGIPRTINILCENTLLRGYRLSKRRVTPDIIQDVIKNLEGPVLRKSLLSSVSAAIEGIGSFSAPLSIPFKKVFIAILVLLSAGAAVLSIYEHRQGRSLHTWGGKISFESPRRISPAAVTLPSAPDEDNMDELVIVKEGQTISSIAEQFYRTSNPSLIAFILDSNPEVANADFITVGQKIRVPQLAEESLILIADHAYKILVGTFPSPDFADLYRNERSLEEKEIEVIPQKVAPKYTWYRIVIGKFNDKEEALKTTHLLREKKLLPFFSAVSKK